MVGAEARPPTLLVSAPYAFVGADGADASPATLLACAPSALVGAETHPYTLLTSAPLAPMGAEACAATLRHTPCIGSFGTDGGTWRVNCFSLHRFLTSTTTPPRCCFYSAPPPFSLPFPRLRLFSSCSVSTLPNFFCFYFAAPPPSSGSTGAVVFPPQLGSLRSFRRPVLLLAGSAVAS
jgi:hypothetical protein